MDQPTSRVLSSSQLALLAEHGEERTAEVGTVLFKIGDETYPFIAILEGEAQVLDESRWGCACVLEEHARKVTRTHAGPRGKLFYR